jgi:type IV pilus assembly protein PilA
MGAHARALATRDLRDQRGYSLIELMVVVLIIGILVAIALPTFLGARDRASDRSIQSSMRTGLAAALAYYSDAATWTGFDAAQAQTEESRIPWVDGPAAPGPGDVSIQVHNGQQLLLVGLSDSGNYFCLAQVASSPATVRGRGSTFASVNTVGGCGGGW